MKSAAKEQVVVTQSSIANVIFQGHCRGVDIYLVALKEVRQTTGGR